MAISPSTDLYLIKLPIELNDENQLTFSNATAQANYFLGLEKIGETDFTYQRRENAIRYPAHVDSIIQYNYVMYKNENYSNKWFYARIMNMEYVNDNLTLISIEEDAFQTWQFDLNYSQCFVEREHVMDDTIGAHTIPEGLDIGEYEINNTRHFSMVADDPEHLPDGAEPWYVCFVVTTPPDPNNPIPIVPTVGYDIGATFSPLIYFAVKASNGFDDARDIIKWYNKQGGVTADAIKNIYMIPYSCVYTDVTQTWTDVGLGITLTTYAVKSSTRWTNLMPVVEDKVLAGSYTPRNNKLYTWPYAYLYLSNKAGSDVVYHWEDGRLQNQAGTGEPDDYRMAYHFTTSIVPSASLSAKLYPLAYKGKFESSSYYALWNYGISFAKVPVCAWVTDYYTNWLTQNGVNVATRVGMGIAGAALGAATGGLGLLAGAASLMGTVTNAMTEMHQAQVTPDQANGDTNTGDVLYAYTFNNITAYSMTIRPEYSAVIDHYFDCYGYKVNMVKQPNITGRQNWNFVKTVGSAIHADIPQDSCDRINHMFDNGLTLWHNASTFRDYTQPNAIVTP